MLRKLFIILFASTLASAALQAGSKDSYEKVYQECMMMDDFKADDAALNAAYKKLIAALPKEKVAKLKQEQRDWVKECAKMVKYEGRPHKNLCLWTIGRREALEQMLKELR